MEDSGEVKGKAVVAVLGYLFKSDYAIPLIVMEELRKKGIEVIDLSLGAFKAASFLEILSPSKLIILTAEKRGKKEFRIYKPEFNSDPIGNWVTIYRNLLAYDTSIDSFLKVAYSMNVLPKDTIILECEVVDDREDIRLSEWGKECVKIMINEVLRLLNSEG